MSDTSDGAVNLESPAHPHEPEIPPTLNYEGACLVCQLMTERDEARNMLRNVAQHHETLIEEVEIFLGVKEGYQEIKP